MTTSDPYASGDIKQSDESDTPRSLDELLKMDTYQDMSDDEIRLVIAYKEYTAIRNAETDKNLEVERARSEAMKNVYERLHEDASANFARALNVSVKFKAVGE